VPLRVPEGIHKKALIQIRQSAFSVDRTVISGKFSILPQTVNPTWGQGAGRGEPSLQAGHRDTILAVVTATVLIAAIQLGVALKGLSPVFAGGLLDTDDYMRLVRAEYLWRSGAWFDAVIPRIDPPNGLALHWTRPMDILLIAGAGLASPFLGFQAALFWWGAFVSPVLMIVSLIAIVWAAAPFIPRQWLPLVAFFFVAQPGDLTRFMIGRPDHHGLLILLFILTLGFALRTLTNPERKFDTVAAGLVGAIAVWVSIESLVMVFAVIAALGLCWLLGDRRMLRALVRFSVAMLAGLGLALLIERGPMGLSAVEIDKISILHLAMFALNALTWWGLCSVENRGWFGHGPMRRAIVAGGAMAMSLLLLWVQFPQAFANPMGTGGDLYMQKHFVNIGEIQPLIDTAKLQSGQWPEAVGSAILWLGIAIPVLPWLAYRLWHSQGVSRRLWLFIGIASVAYVPLTLYQVRWASYAETVLVLPYADLAAAIAGRLSVRFSEKSLSVIRPFLIAAMCIWVFVPNATIPAQGNDESFVAEREKECPIKELSAVLNDPAGLGNRSKRLLAMIDFGPEFLYRTRHSVLSIPNHRPQPGFTASYRIMTAVDFQEANRLLVERQVDLVAICVGSNESWFYKIEGAGRTLYQALSDGAPPDFLVPVSLPDDVGGFRLFEVRPAG
jgi:hypothetical protein